jgi:hypothetical protein
MCGAVRGHTVLSEKFARQKFGDFHRGFRREFNGFLFRTENLVPLLRPALALPS